jgi:4-amino-4-deoxy-L-arabinose transferase-like glycosyltransferase
MAERRAILTACAMIDPDSSTCRPSRSASVLIAGFGAIAVGALFLRCVSIAEPLGIDQSLWASAVRGMSRGQRLYADVWEQRPPGIYWAYLLGFHVFGWTASAVAWLDIVAVATTTVLIFAIGRALGGALAGAVAAAFYSALTMPAWLYGHGGFLERSVSETFIVVCVCLGAWCAVKFRERGTLPFAAGVGLCAGLAGVFKPNAVLYFPATLLWMVLYGRDRATSNRPALTRAVAVAVLASTVVPIVTLLWLWQLSILHEARIAVVDFNRFYVSQGFTVGGYALDFSKAVWLRMKTDPLWLAGAVGALVAVWDLARTRRLPPLAGLAVILGAAAVLVIVVNGARLFNSYFIPPLATLALLAAWLFTESAERSSGRRMIAMVTGALMLVLLVYRGYLPRVLDTAVADFNVLTRRTDLATYLERFGGYANQRGYSARANAELAVYVRDHTDPGEQIFLFGINGAGVYFASDRLTAHRFLRVNVFVSTEFPDPRFRLDAVVRDLAVRRPRYIIFEQLHAQSEMGKTADALVREPSVIQLLQSYHLETQIEDFTLYRRLD